MDFIPADWPMLGRVAVATVTGAAVAVTVLMVLYVVARYLVVAPPTPLERLYSRVRRGPAHEAAHAWTGLYTRVQGRGTDDLLPVVVGWHERIGKT